MEILKLDDWEVIPENYTGIVEYPNGTLRYYLNGKYHREDGPASIGYNDTISYYINGECHREDGPASIDSDGKVRYFINGKEITKEVKDWIKDNNIPEVWNNSHKLLFKLTFG